VKVDREIEQSLLQLEAKAEIFPKAARGVRFRCDDDAVKVRIALNDRCGERFDEVGELRGRVGLPDRLDCGRRQNDIADQAKTNQKDAGELVSYQSFSTVASSISITGMSSLMGYTRLHLAHFSAVPFLTSVTGVLQFGHARISSNSGSTAMSRLYDTSRLLWNNSGV
jgi:hypothetical protein